jgi:hypothetical protein
VKIIFLVTGLYTGFTALDVDPQVVTTDGSLFDVVFIGTSAGTETRLFCTFFKSIHEDT